MKSRKIIIENGTVYVPGETKMTIAEIANLFDIYYNTVKLHIRTIERSGLAGGDYSGSCTCEGSKIYPDYYGLDMVIAVAFRLQSAKTEGFRRWVVRKVSKVDIPEILIMNIQNPILN